MKIKNKYLAMIRSFSGLESHFHAHNYLWEKISESFEKIYVINDDYLKFFPSMKQSWIKQTYDYEKIKKFAPNNIQLFNPKNTKDFDDFIFNKELIVINQFRRLIPDLKTHLIIKKHNFKQIQITNFGHGSGMSQHTSLKKPIKMINWYFKILSKKIFLLLSIMGIINKIDIRFISDKKIINNIKNNKIKSFLYKKKLLFSKELILVNSRNYDILIDKKNETSEEYIVHLDADLNYWQEVELRGKMDQNKIDNHYHYLEKFLQKLSETFDKKVIVCIHPGYDLNEIQKHFKKFKVLKYRTPEFIYKSFLVTNFDSSAIIDAVLLKKKIIGLISNFMTENEISHSKSQAERCGYLTMNFKNDLNFNKDELLRELNEQMPQYEKKMLSTLCVEPNVNGTEKIIKIIKERFF